MTWVGIILIVVAFVMFINATEKVRYGEFDESAWYLACFGIYQWGQGLVLAGFWILFGLGCLFWWTPNQAMRGYLLFHVVRAAIELVLLTTSEYRGLLAQVPLDSKKMTETQRLQLYMLSQGLLILGGLLFFPLLPIK